METTYSLRFYVPNYLLPCLFLIAAKQPLELLQPPAPPPPQLHRLFNCKIFAAQTLTGANLCEYFTSIHGHQKNRANRNASYTNC